MFDSLTERLSRVLADVRGRGRISEDNVRDSLRQVRIALIEADVAIEVIGPFLDKVRERAVGDEVARSLKPGEVFIRIVQDELAQVLGASDDAAGLALRTRPPAVILLAGLQGTGKTTTAGKLARWLLAERKRSILMVSVDVHRPAAMEQLVVVGESVGAGVLPPRPEDMPETIAADALAEARRRGADVLIVDTAGRTHIDEGMMEEVSRVHAALDQPAEVLFVVDAMAGQDAVQAARAFGASLPLTGAIVTKADGDARGGAALSVREVTGVPIRFLGTGEKLDQLEPFHPGRMASRILGMGDVVSLVEKVERQVDEKDAERVAKKIQSGRLDLGDFREQLRQMLDLGGLASLMAHLPGQLPGGMQVSPQAVPDDGALRRQIAIIDSMTPLERRKPDLIDGSRRRRIAGGSGAEVVDVSRLVKQFGRMQKMMRKAGKGGMGKMLKGGRAKPRSGPGGMPGGKPRGRSKR
jgi:signal recognition particle subunit SRP54